MLRRRRLRSAIETRVSVWMTALMQNRNQNRRGCNNEVKRVRESLKKCASYTASNFRKLKWILRDAFQKGVDS
jgi:hypothetical protein